MGYKRGIARVLFHLFFLVMVCVTGIKNARAQYREYEFNSKGNVCYLKYVSYAPNNEYSSIKRPFLFILGAENQSAIEVYLNDSLRLLPQFYHYMFVYIPNRGGLAQNKLVCIDGLASIMTYNNKYGNVNNFLNINDPSIDSNDIKESQLSYSFKNIRYSKAAIDSSNPGIIPQNNVTETFKETYINYEPIIEEEPGGRYYVEESEAENETDLLRTKPHKTYFGAPKKRNFVFTGIVRDRSTGEALPFASVLVKGTTMGVSTNADGYFTLSKVPTDTSTLIVHYVGFEKTEIFLSPFDPVQNFRIELSPNTQSLKAVTIIGKKEEVVLADRSEVNTVKLSPRKLEQIPNLGEKDVMRSFQLMPGISASNESSSGLYVRGGTPDQNLVLYDGMTVYHVDHLYGFFSAFNSNALKDVQLYKSGFESRFGGRLSSVTEITAKDGNQKKFNLGGDLSLLSLNLFTEIPIGEKFTSIITYRRSYKGPIYDKLFSKFNTSSSTTSMPGGGGPGGDRFMQETEATSYFYDLNGKFTFKPNNKDIYSLSIFKGTDKLDNSTSMEAPSFGGAGKGFGMNSTDLTQYGNNGLSLKWSRKWSPKLYSNTVLSYSNYFSERDKTQDRTVTNTSGDETTTRSGIIENNDLRDYSLRSDYQWDILDFSQLQFGGFSTYYDIKYNYSQNDTAVLDRQNYSTLSGAYVQTKLKFLKDKLQIIPGIRASYYHTTHKFYAEPRASLSYSLNSKISLKGSTGKFYQFANRVTREDILSGSKDFWVLSDDISIPVSSAIHYTAGISYESNNYLLSAEAYYKEISNLSEYSLRIKANPMEVSYSENFFTGNGYSKGIEFLAQKKNGNFNGWISYTIGEAKNKFSIYTDGYFPANQDVNHEFKVVALYKYKRWDFSATWVYATGRPYTAPSGAYTITLLDGTTKDYFTVTDKNGVRLPAYHRADVSVTYKLLKGSKGDKRRQEIGNIGFSIFNIYNRTNVWYKQFSIEDGQIIETNVNYLGFTPNLTLSLKLR
jgi:ferric enterobactin receptor